MQKLSFTEIQQTYKKIQTLDAKNRFHAIKTLAHTIHKGYKKDLSNPEEMEFYINIIKEVVKLHGSRYSKFLTKLIGDWLETTGNADAKIITKINGVIDTDDLSIDAGSGIIAVGNPAWFSLNKSENIWEINQLELINKGEIFIFHFEPLEKPCNIQIRVVDASKPVLTAKEFRCVLALSETAVINIPSNTAIAADPQAANIHSNQITANIVPGNYKICAYHFRIPNKLESFYIVLCKTDNEATNKLLNICRFFS